MSLDVKERIDRVDIRTRLCCAITLCIGCLFVLVWSLSTSPIYRNYYGGDSAQFLTMGKGWYQGVIPYRDMFDNKGPVIFLMNMLGYALVGGRSTYGVLILQMVSMIVSAYGIWKFTGIYLSKPLVRMVISVAAIVLLKLNYVDGDSVEEYCLPYLVWTSFYLVQYVKQKEGIHRLSWSFLYGITIAVCLMSRATNMVPVIFLIGLVLILVVKRENAKAVFNNVLAGFLGLSLVLGPFFIYFAVNGCFADFLDQALLINFSYLNGAKPWVLTAKGSDWLWFVKKYVLYWTIWPLIAVKLVRKEWGLSVALLLTAVLETYIYLSGFRFDQYPFVCVIQLVWMLCELWGMLDSKTKGNEDVGGRVCTISSMVVHKLTLAFISLMLLYASYVGIRGLGSSYVLAQKCEMNAQPEWQCLMDEVPLESKNKLVFYGDWENKFKEAYLKYDIMPCYRYWVIQPFQAGTMPSIVEKIRAEYSSCEAEYIIGAGDWYPVEDIVMDNYELVDVSGKYTLYHMKD